MPSESAQPAVVAALAAISGLQALLTGVAKNPVSWMTGHLLEQVTRESENDELRFNRFFHCGRYSAERREVLTEFVEVAGLATATVWSMLIAGIILLALGVVASRSDEDGWMVACGLCVIAVLVAGLLMFANVAKGQVRRYPLGKRDPRRTGLQLEVARYWQNLRSLDTLTLLANLFAVVVAAFLA
jgi:hypothetical protein